MEDINSYDKLVIKSILSCKDFNIKEVNHLESLKSMIFDRDQYPSIISLIKNQNWEAIKQIDNKTKGFREYLDVIIFFDQNKKEHVATIYDSDELLQDPEIIDIFPLNE